MKLKKFAIYFSILPIIGSSSLLLSCSKKNDITPNKQFVISNLKGRWNKEKTAFEIQIKGTNLPLDNWKIVNKLDSKIIKSTIKSSTNQEVILLITRDIADEIVNADLVIENNNFIYNKQTVKVNNKLNDASEESDDLNEIANNATFDVEDKDKWSSNVSSDFIQWNQKNENPNISLTISNLKANDKTGVLSFNFILNDNVNSASKNVSISGFWTYKNVINDLLNNVRITPSLEAIDKLNGININNINDNKLDIDWNGKNKYGLAIGTNADSNIKINWKEVKLDLSNKELFLRFTFEYKDYISSEKTYKVRDWLNENDLKECVVGDFGFNIKGELHRYTGSGGNIIIPDSFEFKNKKIIVKKIANRTFMNNKNITSIKLPNNLEQIGDYAFYESNLQNELIIPNSVTSIGISAFENTKITSLKFQENSQLKAINQSVFRNITTLTKELIIPNSVTTIDGWAFSGSKITSLKFQENSQLKTIGIAAFQSNEIKNELIIPNSVITIKGWAFNGSRLTSLKFQENSQLKIIDIASFNNNNIQGGLIIPNSVMTIDDAAFSGSKITSLKFQENSQLKTIGIAAFQNNDIQNDLIIPKSVATLQIDSFKGNNKLMKIIIYHSYPNQNQIANSNTQFELITNNLQTK